MRPVRSAIATVACVAPTSAASTTPAAGLKATLDAIGYTGPISIEWEDAGMDRLHGAAEAVGFVRSLLWEAPTASFDAAFSNQGTDG